MDCSGRGRSLSTLSNDWGCGEASSPHATSATWDVGLGKLRLLTRGDGVARSIAVAYSFQGRGRTRNEGDEGDEGRGRGAGLIASSRGGGMRDCAASANTISG